MQYEVKFTLYPAHIAILYLIVITIAEIITAAVDPWMGIVCHIFLLVGMIFHTAFTWHDPSKRFLISLTFAPLIRILSLSLPLAQFPLIYWFFITSIPLFMALFLIVRTLGFSADRVGLNTKQWLLQLLIVPTGLLFGIAEYYILRPEPLISSLSWSTLAIPALILLVSTGFFEEVAFRGIMQSTALETLGRFGLVYIALIFAVLHIGYLSFLDVGFVFAVGLFFGWVVLKTGSIVGVTFSHGLTNIMLFLVMPFLVTWNGSTPPVALGNAEAGQAEAGQVSEDVFISAEELALSNPILEAAADSSNQSPEYVVQTATPEGEAIFIAAPTEAPGEESGDGPTEAPTAVAIAQTTPTITGTVPAKAAQTEILSTETTSDASETEENNQRSTNIQVPNFSLLPTQTSTTTPEATETSLPTNTATDTAEPTVTEIATATPKPTETLTPEPTETSTEVPTETPTETPQPTATATPTFTPPPTFTPLPTATQTATFTPLPPIVAIHPANGAEISDVARFEWLSEETLDADQRLELVFWKEGQQPLIDGVGLAVTNGANQINVNLQQLDLILRDNFTPGIYRWGLIRVQTAPQYERLSYEGGGHTVIYTK